MEDQQIPVIVRVVGEAEAFRIKREIMSRG